MALLHLPHLYHYLLTLINANHLAQTIVSTYFPLSSRTPLDPTGRQSTRRWEPWSISRMLKALTSFRTFTYAPLRLKLGTGKSAGPSHGRQPECSRWSHLSALSSTQSCELVRPWLGGGRPKGASYCRRALEVATPLRHLCAQYCKEHSGTPWPTPSPSLTRRAAGRTMMESVR